MLRRVMVIAVIAVLAIGGYFVYSTARSLQDDTTQTPTGAVDIAKDQAAKSNLVGIRTAIQAYTAANGQLPPAADQATLGGYLSPWPTNPWTDLPMKPGASPGDFAYAPGAGSSFSLSVYLADGSVAAAP